jgi:uncharacterized metal-binding protein YceD (DUF177 family)
MLAEYIGIAKLNDLIAKSAESDFSAPVSELSRVQQVIVDSNAATDLVLTVMLRFRPALAASSATAASLPVLSGTIKGELYLECQRCLEPMRWCSDIDFEYSLQLPGSGNSTLIDLFETIEVTERGLLLKELIEDELLSAIPFAPKHDDEKLCARLIAAEVKADVETGQEQTYQPFTGLADLLSSNSSVKDDESTK